MGFELCLNFGVFIVVWGNVVKFNLGCLGWDIVFFLFMVLSVS